MRKKYDISGEVKRRISRGGQTGRSAKGVDKKIRSNDLDDESLSRAEVRKLRWRITDVDDPTRYLLVSQFGPRFALYYNVSDDLYTMNEPAHATLFKRRAAALAVRRLLGRGIRIVRCTTKRRKGLRVPVLEARSQQRKKSAKS